MHKYLVLMMLAVLPLQAQQIPPESDFQRILLPLTTFQSWRGAYGTDWRTELSIRNSSDRAIHIFGNYNSNFCLGVPILCPGGQMLPANSVATILWRGLIYPSGQGEGAFFYIPREADEIYLNLVLFERTFGHQSEGVEIPLVRQSRMLTAPVELLNVSTSPSSRRLLRVYASARPDHPDALTEVLVGVKVYPLEAEELLADFLLSLPIRYPTSSLPQYAEARLNASEWPLLATTDRIRVRVEPVSPRGVAYWAFVSVTDNETQHVTIVSPQ